MSKSREAIETISDLTLAGLLRTHIHLLAYSILLVAINRAAGLAWPYLSKYLIDDVILRHSPSTLAVLVGVGMAATVIQAVSAYLVTRVVGLYANRLVTRLRQQIHRHVSRLPLAYYDANRSGDLASRIMSDIEAVNGVLSGGFASFLGAVATACLAITILIRIDAVMTLAVFSVLIPCGLFLRKSLNKYQSLFKEIAAIRAEVNGRLIESFGGMRVVKAYRAEAREHDVFKSRTDHLLQKVIVSVKGGAHLELTTVILTGTVGAVVMYFGGNGVINGTITLGNLFRYVMFLGLMVSPLIQAVSMGMQISQVSAGLARSRELLAEPREDQDPGRSVQLGSVQGEVCFDSVSFAYGDNSPVLHDISFRAEPGTVTALVGPSGAGKTTITGLIAGFYKVGQGTVRVDGFNLAKVKLDSYRTQLGIVTQDPFLFSGTIWENVAFSRPDATTAEIIRACRLAYVDEFAERFENTYETVVGERGVRLSMGQKQRVAIARAILADPRILILDEATSSLDSVSEAIIQDALSFLLRDRTTFVIAHRFSTIRRADQILVIDGGRIVESGPHELLFKAEGRYWQLYTTQYELQSDLFVVTDGERPLITG